MADNTKIEWATHTFNPWVGCTKVSPACDHCYAEGWAKRSGMVQWGNHPRRRTSAANWRKPLKWNAEAARTGERPRVFCASLADVFDNQVPDGWRRDLWELIAGTPHLDWLLLTKRPQNIAKMLPADWEDDFRNVWLGTTAEDEHHYRQRWAHIAAVPAAVRFLSYEPALGPLGDLDLGRVGAPDWIIAGGESGGGARPPHPDWFRDVRDQCAATGVAFHFKQWGEWGPGSIVMTTGQQVFRVFPDFQTWVNKAPTWVNGGACLDAAGRPCRIGADFMRARDEGTFPVTVVHRVGKARAGRLLDGVQHDGFPS